MAGRPPGSPNKISSGAKANIVAVFDKIGGREKMTEWANANLTEFYKLYSRLLPTSVEGGDPENPVIVRIERKIVEPAK